MAVPAPIEPAPISDVVVVEQGDSLWSIAAKPEIYGALEKRDVQYAIRIRRG